MASVSCGGFHLITVALLKYARPCMKSLSTGTIARRWPSRYSTNPRILRSFTTNPASLLSVLKNPRLNSTSVSRYHDCNFMDGNTEWQCLYHLVVESATHACKNAFVASASGPNNTDTDPAPDTKFDDRDLNHSYALARDISPIV